MPLDPASPDVITLIESVIADEYPDLLEAEVKVAALFATSAKGGAAVKLHGYPCLATIKLNSPENRLQGEADATIKIDQGRWDDAEPEARRALIAHEINHLELKRDKQGQVVPDDAGRPKMRLKLHDYQIGGFASIVERYGDHAPERAAAVALREDFGQLLWDWAPTSGERKAAKAARKAARALKDAAAGLIGDHPGIESVTLSMGGRSVELASSGSASAASAS